jgi:geranylgeranyl pyrophosphate synthase
MTLSAFAEVHARSDYSFSLSSWRQMAEGKSGALFGLCGALVSLLVEEPELADRFDAMGRHLGVAFQIADDIDDLSGDVPADLRDGNPSFPILAASHAAPALRQRLQERAPLAALAAEIRASPTLASARRAIQREVTDARLALGSAAEHPALSDVWEWAGQLGASAAPERAVG